MYGFVDVGKLESMTGSIKDCHAMERNQVTSRYINVINGNYDRWAIRERTIRRGTTTISNTIVLHQG